ncbi:transglycosylase domain-containing protein [Phenylobacterium deserti]|uniref:transglycosylase domain-containing protein n=1 Tax=Phenylobacterium deserti TaxID=1914756 RepID=UPI00197B5D19|nr:PBP1A family penicillin-binding protein [Phenylobacterium deserti]
MTAVFTGQPADPTEAPGAEPRPWYARRRVQVAIGAASLLVLLLVWLSWAVPVHRALEPLPTPTLVLVTADGKPFSRRGSYKEAPVDATKLPAQVTEPFVAIEDRRFYQHMGLDLRSIFRAVGANLRAGEVRQGGSTITQQLAKNAFLSNKRSFRRKAQEAIIALYLELRLSKPEILSRYLSTVYFGDGVFGLRAAARHYFDKAPEQLTVGEASMLAGLVKAPTRLAPTNDEEAARRRMRVVLAALVEQGKITPAQAQQAARQVKVREGRASLPVGSYFADWISPQVRQAYNRAFGEVTVWTTLDSQLQLQAQQAVRRGLAAARGMGVTQAALVAMRADGRVVAMVGGSDYRQSQFNRAVQAERQPGSAFKTFVYLAALRSGMTPDTAVLDAPVTIGGWSPENHEGRYAGRPVPLRDAFARSSNVAAARLIQQVGVSRVAAAARDLGVTSPLPNDATLALGTGTMSLLELTSAYAAIANGGGPVVPRGMLNQPPERPAHRLSSREQEELKVLLREVVERGTGTGANLGPQVVGKTGTSQDYRDAWFVGFAGDMVVGVWVGNDDNTPMRKVTGGSIPAIIWRDFMQVGMKRADLREPVETEQTFEQSPLIDLEAIEPLELPDPNATFEEGESGPEPLPIAPPQPLELPAAPPPPQIRPEPLETPAVDEPADPEPEPAPGF